MDIFVFGWTRIYMKKALFTPTPFSLLKGVFSGAEGGIIFGTDPVSVGHGQNWPRVV